MAIAKTPSGRRFSRRQTTLFWIFGVTVIVCVLLYFERADVLYVLSTLGVIALLIAVATADLSGSKKNPNQASDEWNATKPV